MNKFRGASSVTFDPWDGLVLVDKPQEYTSHDVVAKLRGRFRIKKVGHGGTLDPMATGLLVILTGRGTKLSEQIMGGDKTYEGTMTLGTTTDTQDADGNVLEEKSADDITDEQILEQMKLRVGDIMQTPPMVSAIKKDGVPLYKLARKGKEIEREARLIHIYRFKMTGREGNTVHFEVKCTKGTYVRTLCYDIGEALGCGAHLSALRRTASGNFDLKDAHTLDDLVALDTPEFFKRITPISKIVSML